MTTINPPASRPKPDWGPTRSNRTWLKQMLLRFHFYAGILAGPFILVASITGAMYAFAPQIGQAVHGDITTVPAASGTPVGLDDQLTAAQTAAGPESRFVSVEPAVEPTDATKFVFAETGGASDNKLGVFVNPADGTVTGTTEVYGRGGSLPIVEWLSTFHRDLHLGDVGVIYSELAASWLGFICLGGLWLWGMRLAKKRQRTTTSISAASRKGPRTRNMSWHAWLGVAVLIPAILLAITGITWSDHAGGNIKTIRKELGWTSQRVDTTLPNPPAPGESVPPVQLEQLVSTARAAGIDADTLQVSAPRKPGTAWTVAENGRQVPLQRDAVAIDPRTMSITNTMAFDNNPLVAKLITWGILFHFGSLFGLANQILLAVVAVALVAMTILGYVMWWQRRPTRGSQWAFGAPYRRGALRSAPWYVALGVVFAAAATAWLMPVLAWSLGIFVAVDLALAARASAARRSAARMNENASSVG